MEKYLNKIVLFLLTLSLMSFRASNVTTLTIEFAEIKNDTGKIMLLIFHSNKAKYFPIGKAHAYKKIAVPIHNRKASTKVNLPYGTYAITVLHDEDGDQKMKKNFFGIPKEGFAFSNNYKPRISLPDFDDADFKVNTSSKKIQIKVLYY